MINRQIGHYLFNKIIGSGSWATVVRATDTRIHRDVAIKVIPKEKSENISTLGLTKEAIKILASLDHPNIIKYYDTIEEDNFLYVVTELCEGINLIEWIIGDKNVNENKIMKVMPQIIDAILYLHEKRISHGDIKLENIIVNPKTFKIKLIDFGFAKNVKIGEKIHNEYVTLSYCAPERLLNERYCPLEADIWALGVVYYCLKTKTLPFWDDGDDEHTEMEKIVIGSYKMPKNATNFDKQFLTQTLCYDPSSRADAKTIANLFKIHKSNTINYFPNTLTMSHKFSRFKTTPGLPPLKMHSSFP